MGFGKRVCEILAVVGALVLIGVLVWYLSSAMGDRGYEKGRNPCVGGAEYGTGR